MTLGQGRTRAAAQIPTASMADIAFLLLVFFLVTTVFDEERGLPLVLPAEEAIDVAPTNVLQLHVRANGTVEVQRGASPLRQSIAATEIGSLWQREAARNPALIASLRTDAAAPYGAMVGVLDALQQAGATRIALGVWDR